MIFRTANGDLVEINKYDLKNDALYYKKIMDLKKEFLTKKSKKEIFSS